MYLSFSEYINLGGEPIDERQYADLEYHARRLVDNCTCDRVRAENPVRESVQRLMYRLINDELASPGSSANGVQSVSNDGVSVVYTQTSEHDQLRAKYNTIIEYLAGETTEDGTPLLYAGVMF